MLIIFCLWGIPCFQQKWHKKETNFYYLSPRYHMQSTGANFGACNEVMRPNFTNFPCTVQWIFKHAWEMYFSESLCIQYLPYNHLSVKQLELSQRTPVHHTAHILLLLPFLLLSSRTMNTLSTPTIKYWCKRPCNHFCTYKKEKENIWYLPIHVHSEEWNSQGFRYENIFTICSKIIRINSYRL